MSIQGTYRGGLVNPSDITRLTTTSATTIFTAVNSSQTLAGFSLANETASAVIVACHFNDGTTDFLFFRRSVPANDTVIVTDIPIRMRSGDSFKVTAATGNAITVAPVMLENFSNEVAYGAGSNSLAR